MAVTNSDLNREIGEVKQLVTDMKDENKRNHKEISEHLKKLNGQVASNTRKVLIHSFIFKIAGTFLTSGLLIYLIGYIIPKGG